MIYWATTNGNTRKRSNVSTQFVLDAWALLAMLQGAEPAASRVRELLRAGERHEAVPRLSMINLGEVYYRTGATLVSGDPELHQLRGCIDIEMLRRR
jgi:hypothetical protein